MIRSRKIALLNPNSSLDTTEAMLKLARLALSPGFEVKGFTAESTPKVLLRPEHVADAAVWVASLVPRLEADGFDAVIVAAFGDPGVAEVASIARIPVIGIGQAGMAEAARNGRMFSIVTTTPAMRRAIAERAKSLGHGSRLASIRITEGDPHVVMKTQDSLEKMLTAEAHRAITQDLAQAVLIGGGPLAPVAARVARSVGRPVIEPVAAAVAAVVTLLLARDDAGVSGR